MNYLNREYMSRQRGGVVIKVLFFIPLLVLLVFGFYEGRKAYWDYQVKEMCEKDGGTRIIENIFMSRSEAESSGLMVVDTFVIPSRSDSKIPANYYIDYESTDIRVADPRVFRSRTILVRAIDEKVLAEMISYSRSGGDFPTFAHSSSVSCYDADDALLKFRATIKIKEEMK